jgi:resuscitation-promoting factor RpfB
VRPPKTRILGYGTKAEVRTAVVDGVEIEYWRAVQMYATSYSPCRSGADRCYPGTSSGKSLRKGMVAMRYRLVPGDGRSAALHPGLRLCHY